MNVTELLTNVQSQSAAGSPKTAGAATGSVFKSLLADGLAQTGTNQAADQLLDLISQLNSDQIAQLLAMMGINPQSAQLGTSATGNSASAGAFPANTQLPPQLMLLQNLPQASAGFLLNAVQLQPAKNETAKPGQAAISQVQQTLSELLNQAGMSVQDAVNQLENTVKHGGDLAGAFRQLIDHAKQPPEQRKFAGALSADGAIAAMVDAGSVRQSGSQIRPDMLNAVTGISETHAAASENGSTANFTPATQATADLTQANGAAQNFTAAAFSTVKSHQAYETQPAPVQVKMSAGQFQSDFPGMLVKQATLTERGGFSEMRVTLMPEGMGQIHVRIQGEGGLVSLQIAADSQQARSLLDANLGILKHQLEAQGMQLNRVEVVTPNSSAGMSNMDQGMFDGRSRQQQDTGQQQSNRQPSNQVKYQFEDELLYQNGADTLAGQYDWTA